MFILTRLVEYDILFVAEMPGGHHNGGGCFPIQEEVQIFFCLPHARREVMSMYITWETLFLFCTLVVAIIGLVVDIHNNKKR